METREHRRSMRVDSSCQTLHMRGLGVVLVLAGTVTVIQPAYFAVHARCDKDTMCTPKRGGSNVSRRVALGW